jgi:hypothetical protein
MRYALSWGLRVSELPVAADADSPDERPGCDA